MNKKLLALAIAAALVPAAAMADSGNVKISGVMHMSLDSLKDGSNRNTNVSSNSSKISFSGDEDLGNGLKAIWNVDSYVRLDNTSSSFADGNTFAGLTGGFGTAILGKHDTPMKIVGRKVDLFGDQIGDSRNMISNGGIGDLRAPNVVAYISPTIGGFHGAIAHVTNADNLAASDASTKAWSGLAMYEAGPAMAAVSYEKHNVAGTNADPKQWRVVGGYNLGDVKLVGSYQKSSDLGAVSGADRKVWGLGAAFKMGATTIKGQFYKAGELANVTTSDAKMYVVGADYSLSKRTTTYVAYAKVNNDSTAAFSAFGGGHGDQPAIAAGQDPSGFSLGMKHSF